MAPNNADDHVHAWKWKKWSNRTIDNDTKVAKLASCARLYAWLFPLPPPKNDSGQNHAKSIGGFTISQLWRFQQAEPGQANSVTTSQTAMDHAATLWKFTATLRHSWPRHTLTKRRTLKAPVLPWYRPPNEWLSSNCSDNADIAIACHCHGQRSKVYIQSHNTFTYIRITTVRSIPAEHLLCQASERHIVGRNSKEVH